MFEKKISLSCDHCLVFIYYVLIGGIFSKIAVSSFEKTLEILSSNN